MSQLDAKINQHFAGLVVRKDLVKAVKGNAIVPSLRAGVPARPTRCVDEATIQAGIDTVRQILADHYVHRNQSELVKSTIRERGRHKIIDKVTVTLNDKDDVYEAEFANLGIKRCSSSRPRSRPTPSSSSAACGASATSSTSTATTRASCRGSSARSSRSSSPTSTSSSTSTSRREFTTDEWIDLLIQSIGFNPELFGRRAKLIQLVRLIPFVERNYNLVELGPKGTGKSHIFSEFSPHGMLISGGEVTVPKLFVNNSNGRIGLVGYWDVVAFDEFAGKKKRTDKALVDIMKNYMANKSFSRGVETLGAEASMVFVGNTSHNVPYMLKHSDLFDELPESYHDSAYLDRLHHYIPGWEVDTIRGEMFSDGYGFVVDYIAEVLKSMRNADYSDRYQQHFTLGSDISTRDRDGIHKTFSGLMKILYPSGEARRKSSEEILRFAIEGRKRVKDQILRIDATFEKKSFSYQRTGGGEKFAVKTAEEEQYPTLAGGRRSGAPGDADSTGNFCDRIRNAGPFPVEKEQAATPPSLQSGEHVVVPENVKGYSYRRLFAAHLAGARKITIYDPYIRAFWQIRNCLELLQLVNALTPDGEEVQVELVTQSDEELCVQQDENLNRLVQTMDGSKVTFSFTYDNRSTFHARSIQTDTGWKISIDRGLDLFQRYDMNALSLAAGDQTERLTKGCEITYLRE